MKKIYPIIGLVILSYIINYYYLKISTFLFTGMVLGVLVFSLFILNFVIKFINRNNPDQEKYAYAIPDPLAHAMKNIDQRTQYESGILSMFFILVGMVAFMIYMIFFTTFDWWFKTLFLFNSVFGCLFMFSNLITSYQAYVTYMTLMDEMKNNAMTFNTQSVQPNSVQTQIQTEPKFNSDKEIIDKILIDNMKGGLN